ncbi:hypothetical protein LZ32DRAFT_601012 [Colletotrichum eremochloae]|nr:hypothetical protein LZ32DRAFT_601012 [Colletotrichum eremochloae]
MHSALPDSTISAALGAVLGYIGAEAATTFAFERLLWPQRFFSRLNVWSTFTIALLTPMGGPMHKAALNTLDIMFARGLLEGPQRGSMLGSAFFPELDRWSYTMYGDARVPLKTEPVRNALFPRALRRMPLPFMGPSTTSQATLDVAENGTAVSRPVRARVAVSHLVLSRASAQDKASNLPLVSERASPPSTSVILGIFISELSAVIVAVIIASVFDSFWCLLWLVPLVLRLLSAVFSVDRESLVSTSSNLAGDQSHDFEIHCPQKEGKFMLITGPPAIVLQFFRHYGHPVRSRSREVIQLGTVIILGGLFPFGLLCSTLWMPGPIASVWLCYQMYVVLVMHLVRYSSLAWASTTEVAIATELSRGLSCSNENEYDSSILFGQERNGLGTIKARVAVTYHNSYGAGKRAMDNLLSRLDISSPSKEWSPYGSSESLIQHKS